TGIYVTILTILAFWVNNEVIAKEVQLWKEEFYEDGIPTQCPFLEKGNATNIPHEFDCTKFYKCHFGRRVLIECPLIEGSDNVRLHYDRHKQVCDWPWLADCINCPSRDKNGNWPQSKLPRESQNCSTYNVCVNGEKHLYICRPPTCFSRTCQRCVVDRLGGNCDL
ncbi:hypothetical protein ALC62_00213, partial [Cyphomyrmex costatus]